MFPRLAAVLITAFWAIMWVLLIRTELEPAGAALREVPVEHVLKLMFHHRQASDLSLRSEGRLIGHLRLLPTVVPEEKAQVLDFSGSLQLRLPGSARQRFSWRGESAFSPALDLQRVELNLTVHQAAQQHLADSELSFAFDAATKQARYETKTGQVVVDRQEFAATEAGLKDLVQRMGLDPGMIQTATTKASSAPPKVTAQRSTFRIRTEEIETLLLTMEYNEQTMLQVHVSQLGQVIHASTVLGWTLEAE